MCSDLSCSCVSAEAHWPSWRLSLWMWPLRSQGPSAVHREPLYLVGAFSRGLFQGQEVRVPMPCEWVPPWLLEP